MTAEMEVLLALAGTGLMVTIGCLAWIMRTLYDIRDEISASHASFNVTLADHERRITQLEKITYV